MSNDNGIAITGAGEHNLKGIDLFLPRNNFIVFSGVSGSGKSSLAFDTLYAEGQRRYVESLSAYARQFLDMMEKPKVDSIEGLSPAISIEQKSASNNPRSTVATVTEVYDYLRVLFARTGTPHCYKCGREVSSQSLDAMVDRAMSLPEGTRLQILAPVVRERKGEYREIFLNARRQGFSRVRVNGRILDLSEEIVLDEKRRHNIEVVLDRVAVSEKQRSRIAESVEMALALSDGVVVLNDPDTSSDTLLSKHLACSDCGISYVEITPQMFSFNSPQGRCEECDGLGTTTEIDPTLVVPNPNLSLNDGAVLLLGSPDSPGTRHILESLSHRYGIDLDAPWRSIAEKQKQAILYGSSGERLEFVYRTRRGRTYTYRRGYEGVIPAAEARMKSTSSADAREYYQRFIGPSSCPACKGGRLRPESMAVKVGGQSIVDVVRMSIEEAEKFFTDLKFDSMKERISADILKEIRNRLKFMMDVGLNYLTLDRRAPSLSGGEAQRIRLATQIGSGLVGVLYILDEPTIGLHQRDNIRLIGTLKNLRDLGNTVIVVEHDLETLNSADYIVDFGPGAGQEGGEVVVAGPVERVKKCRASLTGQYLSGKKQIAVPKKRRSGNGKDLILKGARHNNLRDVDVRIPLGTFNCVTGVSGSGKSSLITETLYPALARLANRARARPGHYEELVGVENIDKVVNIDQDPIGRTPRSNPATYVGVFGPIRDIFAQTPEARRRGYRPGRFSFNVRVGRCDDCGGDGVKRIEMLFLADVYIPCETCKGLRYNRETLQVKYKDRNIAEVLEMTVAEALEHFENIPRISRLLQTMADVGLDYIKLGQSAPTLSGGEAQRVKLAKELSRRDTGSTLYILDEPTTGLHLADVEKLLAVLNRLVEIGNTVVVIEHNLEVIKVADHIIDLGPEGGEAGGEIVAEGTPDQLARRGKTYTEQFLKQVLLDGRRARKQRPKTRRKQRAAA